RLRPLVLTRGPAIDLPFFSRYAVSAQRALGQLAALCASEPACRKAFPGWEQQFGELVRAWNAHPGPMTGDELASIVLVMLLDLEKAVSIPLVVSSAAGGDYAPLERAGSGDLHLGDLSVMGSSIWCNEPWTGLGAKGPWGTDFDTLTAAKMAALREPWARLGATGPWGTALDTLPAAKIAALRKACSSVPKRAEPRSLWTLP